MIISKRGERHGQLKYPVVESTQALVLSRPCSWSRV